MLDGALDRVYSLLPADRSGGPAQRFARELAFGFGVVEFVAIGLFSLTELAWGTPELGAIYGTASFFIVLIVLWLTAAQIPAP